MATNNTDQAKSAKEQLLELLEKKPKIYQDAVKWTLACWTGIRMSSLFEDIIFSKMDRTAFLEEFKGLEESGFVRLENDPKGTSEVIVHLSEREEMKSLTCFIREKKRKS